MFFALHFSISLAVIGREASAMSSSPLQNFLKPPPVPEMPMLIFTSGCSLLKVLATASVMRNTVLEPSISILPLSLAEPSLSFLSPPPPVQPNRLVTRNAAPRRTAIRFIGFSRNLRGLAVKKTPPPGPLSASGRGPGGGVFFTTSVDSANHPVGLRIVYPARCASHDGPMKTL